MPAPVHAVDAASTRALAPWLLHTLLVVAGSMLLAVSAQVMLPLWFSPVPVTAQSLAVVLIAAAYGRTLGVATVLAYLLEGAAGLPVFAGFSGSVAHLLGPTGGYLAGFVVAAAVVGTCADRGWMRRPSTALIAMTVGTASIFVTGLAWLALFVEPRSVLMIGLVPFVPGAAFKIGVATVAAPAVTRAFAGRRRG
ncbi:MAG: biotin transporter BioY [Phycisphaerales bacterium]|nr:biotin transporter BioY [Phycisphaerales bacterium]